MSHSTIIEPYQFELLENKLIVKDRQQDEKEILTVQSFLPSEEELTDRELTLTEYFNLDVATMLKEELFFNDIQVEVFRNFLEESDFL